MAPITLHNDRDLSATYVSNHFIDHYMTAANGEYVKIYLYLLRCMGSSESEFSLSAAADKFDHTEKDIQRALKYWEKMHLLRLEYGSDKKLSGIHLLDTTKEKQTSLNKPVIPMVETTIPSAEAVIPLTESVVPAISSPSVTEADTSIEEKRMVTASELSSFQEKEAVRELLFVTEHYLKRPLTTTDIQTIFCWHDDFKHSIELIEYLIEYCVGKGHTSLRYMDKIAIAWKNEGITTVEQAKRASTAYTQLHFSVMKALGIQGRNLIPAEVAFIEKWSNTYGFTVEIITEACSRTIAATHQPSFEYTDGILTSWNKQGVHHLNDIAKLDSDFQKKRPAATTAAKPAVKQTSQNRFHNFTQRTYDFDELEQQLLKGSHT